MIKKVVLAFAVEDYLRTLPRSVMWRAVTSIRALQNALIAMPLLSTEEVTRHIETEDVSIAFFVKDGATLNILRVVVTDQESSNVIWLMSRKRFESCQSPETEMSHSQKRASRND